MTEQPTITQADRDAAAAYWKASMIGSSMTQKLYKSGEFDSSLIVQAFARHRTTSLAAQDGLAMYLLECVYSEVRLEGKLHEDIRDFLYEGKNPLPAMSDVVKALEPFVDLKHQKSAWAIIEKSASDFEPVTLTVTKRQMLDLLSAIKGDKS